MECYSGLGPEMARMSEATDMGAGERLAGECQARLGEALRAGNAERSNYYEYRMAQLGEGARPGAEGIGSAFPELAAEQKKLQGCKRELSSLERQRKPGKENPELEKKIAKAKDAVEKQERAYSMAQQHARSRMMQSVYRGGSGEMGAGGKPEAAAAKDRPAGGAQELSFGGGLGATEIEHIRGSWKVSEASSKRSTASSLESDARRARSAGLPYSGLESRAKDLRSEANKLESEGKRMMSK